METMSRRGCHIGLGIHIGARVPLAVGSPNALIIIGLGIRIDARLLLAIGALQAPIIVGLGIHIDTWLPPAVGAPDSDTRRSWNPCQRVAAPGRGALNVLIIIGLGIHIDAWLPLAVGALKVLKLIGLGSKSTRGCH